MLELTDHNTAAYLREAGRIGANERIDVTSLAGGVSNVVLLVERPERPAERFVLKQAQAQLRVAEPWFCSVERIWREVAYLRACGRLLAPPPYEGDLIASAPAVLWEDRANYAFAMQAAPAKHTTWKTRLLAGDFDLAIARLSGKLLGQLHGRTWLDSAFAADFAERQYFDDLRIDPYYRQLARVQPSLAPAITELIGSLEANRRCLVHGDFSPKNLLVHEHGLMLIDCEVGHYGDPAFDLGFVLTHLVLKEVLHGADVVASSLLQLSLPREFLNAYFEIVDPAIGETESRYLERRMRRNLGGCLLARLAGKSPVEYRDRLPTDKIWKVGMRLLIGELPPATG